MDFTDFRSSVSKNLLVFVDIGRWVESYPSCTETTPVVTKKLFQELILRFGLPLTLGSDSFVGVLLQPLAGSREEVRRR